MEVKAYVDKLIVCQDGQCGAGSSGYCDPNLWVWGHASDGGDVAFTIILRDEEDNVVAHSDPLLSQRGDGVLITSRKNEGPPWISCDLLIPTRGAGGYSLSQHLHGINSLHRRTEVTWKVQVVAGPVKWITTPDGYPLRRECLHQWNWDAMLEADLHVYYKNREYRCDKVVVGELPPYQAPVISSVAHEITDHEDERGYANVSVSFKTDIEAQGIVYYNLFTGGEEAPGQPCDPFGMWQSAISEMGKEHTILLRQDTLWYAKEDPKEYCYAVVAWPAKYRYIKEAKEYEFGTFVI